MTRDEMIKLGMRYSKWATPERYGLLYDLARGAPDGDIVEAGVAMGGSAIMLAGARMDRKPPRRLHLFDSFEGLPEPGPQDGEKAVGMKGRCAAPEASVRKGLGELGYPDDLVAIHAGWFKDTFPPAAARLGAIAVLHLDGDWYESTKLGLEYFMPKVARGAVVILDDYGHWEGCKTATDEYFGARCWDLKQLNRMDGSPQAWFVR